MKALDSESWIKAGRHNNLTGQGLLNQSTPPTPLLPALPLHIHTHRDTHTLPSQHSMGGRTVILSDKPFTHNSVKSIGADIVLRIEDEI